jgi:phosphoribosyl-ATP pyrophosphohydrolase
MADDKQEIIAESADLLYHLTVLLAAKNIEFHEVIKELKSSHNP